MAHHVWLVFGVDKYLQSPSESEAVELRRAHLGARSDSFSADLSLLSFSRLPSLRLSILL